MVRSRRSLSKEDASSVLADSGISLSSPSGVNLPPFEEEEVTLQKLCITDDEAEDNDNDKETPLLYHDDVVDEKVVEADKKPQDVEEKKQLEILSLTTPTNRIKRKSNEKSTAATTVKGAKRKRRTTSTATDTSTTTNATTTTANTKSRKSYECHMCQKQFGGNNDLRRHLLIHTNERPFQCTQCDKSYRQAVNLKNHISSVHNMQRQFRCTLCTKSFALKDRLRLHMRLHSGEKPYACAHCDKRFARGGQLQQHMVTHSAEVKTISCERCSAFFSSAANLRLHMKRHEEGPNHLCNICNEWFISEDILRTHVNMQHYKLKQFDCEVCNQKIEDEDLVSHMRTHSNVKTHICEVCNALFMQKSQYNVHMRMHTGERPYQCRICWQSFAHSSVLKLHIRKHTGEKPFKCLLCKDDVVAFSQLAHLKTHMRKIHKQENPYMCTGCNAFFKVKLELQTHMEECDQCDVSANERMQTDASDSAALSHMRFLIAVLLKRISSEQKLYQLGYEKRLIDNVMIASLKLASRKTYDDHKMSEIDRMRLNVQEFLNWIVPEKVMETFQREQLTVEKTLDKIVALYMKQQQQQHQPAAAAKTMSTCIV